VRAGRPLDVIVECDTGRKRAGVETPREAVALARDIASRPGLNFAGLLLYPPEDAMRETQGFLDDALTGLRASDLEAKIISTGGTPNLANHGRIAGATEHRAGTYIFNDAMVVASGTATWDNCAMRVRATVVSRPTPTRAVIDAGTKVLTSDQYTVKGYGHVLEYPEAAITNLSEEHGIVDLSACRERPVIGDVVHVVPNHCCVVSNMVDEVYGVRAGRVEAVWPVAARGTVR
jgi:D-serine deaminase-like pyridoxal phosphate-dependent protein